MGQWFRNIFDAVFTVLQGMLITFRYWMLTYKPERRTFTEKFEYPELPVPVAARYRGFHRYDLTTCISCDQCAKACPVDCIYIGKERVEGGKGFKITGFAIERPPFRQWRLWPMPAATGTRWRFARRILSMPSSADCTSSWKNP